MLSERDETELLVAFIAMMYGTDVVKFLNTEPTNDPEVHLLLAARILGWTEVYIGSTSEWVWATSPEAEEDTIIGCRYDDGIFGYSWGLLYKVVELINGLQLQRIDGLKLIAKILGLRFHPEGHVPAHVYAGRKVIVFHRDAREFIVVGARRFYRDRT